MKKNRRAILAAGGGLLSSGLAGCLGRGDASERTSTTEHRTSSTTETQTTTRGPYERVHAADSLDTVIAELDPEAVSLQFVPADEDAAYANSVIFDEYSSDDPEALTVEIDLEQAQLKRHHENFAAGSKHVQKFVENVDDLEWRVQILENAGVSRPEERTSWETYTDDSLTYGERMRQSNMWALWYEFEIQSLGSIGSEHNQFKAQALQGAERKAGFDTFVWDYGIPGHGLVGAIENPTRSEDQTEKQEAYVIETDFGDPESQQIATWENSQYQGKELHPVKDEVDRREKGFLSRTGIGGWESDIGDHVSGPPRSNAEGFTQFFKKPESSPAYDHLDPVTTTAYLAEANMVSGDLDGTVHLGTDEITISA